MLVDEAVRFGVWPRIKRADASGEDDVDDDDKMMCVGFAVDDDVSKSEPQTDIKDDAVSTLRLRRAERGWDMFSFY